MNILDNLGHRHGTDKASGSHDYLHFYHRFLCELRDKDVTILEIGVGDGASLRMWRDYFQFGRVIGFDIEPDRIDKAADRIAIEIGDQGNEDDLNVVAERYGPFDVIIDDGGHREDEQILSYRVLLRHLKRGGFYILEDAGGSRAVEFVCRIADGIIKGYDAEELASLCEMIAFYRETTVTKIR